MDQTSSDELKGLLTQYKEIVTEFNNSIDATTRLNNVLAVAKAEVTKNKAKLDLIKEQIMCSKKLLDAGRG